MITLDVTDASTTGGNNGSIDLTVTGGNEPYGYTWSNGGTTEDISGLIAGPYCVTVTDNFGCTANGCETVSEPPPCPTFSFNTIITPATAGSSNGMINLTVIGGIPPYTYSWSNGETTEDINSLSPGTYTVTATDANNCTGTSTFDVPGCAAITFDFGVSLPSTPGTADGSIDVTLAGGTPPFTYSWNNGETSEDISAIDTGLYCLTVTDAENCTQTECVDVDVVGIDDFSEILESVTLFPNPASTDLTVELVPIAAGATTFELKDILGRTLFATDQFMIKGRNLVQFDVSTFSPGLYFLQVEKQGNAALLKFVIGN